MSHTFGNSILWLVRNHIFVFINSSNWPQMTGRLAKDIWDPLSDCLGHGGSANEQQCTGRYVEGLKVRCYDLPHPSLILSQLTCSFSLILSIIDYLLVNITMIKQGPQCPILLFACVPIRSDQIEIEHRIEQAWCLHEMLCNDSKGYGCT